MKNFLSKRKNIAFIGGLVLLVAVIIGLSLHFRPVTENADKSGINVIDNSPVLLETIEEAEVPTTSKPSIEEAAPEAETTNVAEIPTQDSKENAKETEAEYEGPHYVQLPENKKLTVNNDGTSELVDSTNTSNSPSGSGSSDNSGSSNSDAGNTEKAMYVTLNISCHGILDCATDSLKAAIPNEGYLLTSCQVQIKEGDTVYDVLMRVIDDKNIPCTHAASVYGQYISMIDNLSDSKIGRTAGWCYYVNNVMPQVSCDNTLVQDGNVISWEYDDNWDLTW